MSRTNICPLSGFQLLALSSQLSVSAGRAENMTVSVGCRSQKPTSTPTASDKSVRPTRAEPTHRGVGDEWPDDRIEFNLGLHRIGAGACPVGRAVLMTRSRATARTFHVLVLAGPAYNLPFVRRRFGDVGWA